MCLAVCVLWKVNIQCFGEGNIFNKKVGFLLLLKLNVSMIFIIIILIEWIAKNDSLLADILYE